MKKTFKMVMLPSKKASGLFMHIGKFMFSPGTKQDNVPETYPQNLFIISDDEIKESDVGIPQCFNESFNNKAIRYIRKNDKMIDCIVVSDGKAEFLTTKHLFDNADKIIASTDKTITPHSWISESFVKAYVKAFGEGVKISEVDLETEEGTKFASDESFFEFDINSRIKTRDDKSVIIHPSKTYSRLEVEALLHSYRKYAWKNGLSLMDLDKWIETSVK